MRLAMAERWEEEECLLADAWVQSDAFWSAEWHAARKRRRFSPITHCPTNDDLVRRGHAGIPLERSAALVALAEEIVARREPVEFSEEWVNVLAGDLAQFDDD
jgi:hypothetical protein